MATKRINLVVVLLLLSCGIFNFARTMTLSNVNSLEKSLLLTLGSDYVAKGDQVVYEVPDSEMLSKFSGLLPGFKNVVFGLEADSKIVGSNIHKQTDDQENKLTNTYVLDGITVATNYSRSKNLQLDSSPKTTNVKQLVTLTNHSDADRVITLRSKSHISSKTVLWNGKEFELTATPQSFKAFKKTSPVTSYARDVGAQNISGIDAFKDYTYSYYLGNSLAFAGEQGLATYDWRDVQQMDHEVLAYLDNGVPVIELVLRGLEVPANSEITIDPEYILDSTTNYTARITGDNQISGLGNANIVSGDVNGDSKDDLVILAGTTSYANGSSVFVIFGGAGVSTGNLPLSTGTNYNIRYDSSDSLDFLRIGDVNGDGLGDLVLSSKSANNNGAGNGSAWVIFSTLIDDVGNTTGNNKSLSTSTNYNIRFDGSADYEELTYEDAMLVGDLNGDGLGDLVLGGARAANNAGRAYVIFSTLIDDVGVTTGNVKQLSVGTSYNIRYEGNANDYITSGNSMAIGDLNGDGLGDLAIGGYGADYNGGSSGSAWVIFSTLIDDVGVSTGNNHSLNTGGNYNVRYDGPSASITLTYKGFVEIDDLNRDGVGDLILGSFYADYNGRNNSGSIWIIFSTLVDDVGATTGNTKVLTAGNYNIRYDGPTAGDGVPEEGSLSTGDVNGDGFPDLFFGTRRTDYSAANSGSIWVIFSTLIDDIGVTTGNNKDLSNGANYNIRYDGDAANVGLTYLTGIFSEDVNGDGLGDLIIPSPSSVNNGANSGSIYVIFSTLVDDVGLTTGNNSDLATASNYNLRIDGTASSRVGYRGVIALGDVDDDGSGDLIFGSAASYNGSGSGSLFTVASTLIDDVGASTGNVSDIDDVNDYTTRYDGDVELQYVSQGLAVGDVNGDTFADLIVSAPGADYNGADSGSVYVIFGGEAQIAGDKNLTVSSNYNIRYDGAAGDYLNVVGQVADLNGDGLGDLILYSGEADNNGADSGSVWVVFSTLVDDVGNSMGNVKPLTTSSSYNIRYDGESASDNLGVTDQGFYIIYDGIVVGDVNGDGENDLIIGATNAAYNGAGSGSAYVIFSSLLDDFGNTTGNTEPLDTNTNYNIRFDGAAAGDGLAAAGMLVGDVNGDSNPDLVFGGSGADNNGASSGSVWVVFSSLIDDVGASTGNIKQLNVGANYNIRYDGSAGNQFPYGMMAIGDVNGDSLSDLVMSAGFASTVGTGRGSIWLMFSTLIDDVGATTGNNKLLSTGANYNIRYDGDADWARIGFSGELAVGDVNGDSLGDLVFGSQQNRAWVVFSTLIDDVGATTGNTRSTATSGHYNIRYETDDAGDMLTEGGLVSLGDVNGDGNGDLVLGSYFAGVDGFGYGTGAVWVVFSTLIDDVGVSTGNDYTLSDSNNYSYRYSGDTNSGYFFPNLYIADLNNSGRETMFFAGGSGGVAGENAGNLYVVDIPFTMSGTVYTDEGVTNIGAGKTVAISVNGAAATITDDTDGSGDYSFLVPGARIGDTLTLYLEDEPEDAVTVVGYGKIDATDLDLYQDYVIARHDLSSAITNAIFDVADNSGDGDITSLFSVSSSVLTTANNKTLLVPAGKTFAPGNSVNVGTAGIGSDLKVDGTLTLAAAEALTVYGQLDLSGTLTAGSGALSFANGVNQTGGAFTASSGTTTISNGFAPTGGTFAHNSGTLTLSGATQALNIGARTLNNLNINLSNANDDLTITGSVDVAGNLTLTQVDEINTGSLLVSGNIINSDSAVNGTAGINLVGTGTQSIDSSGSVAGLNLNITVNKASGNVELASDLTLDETGQDLTLTQGTLDLAGYDLSVDDTFSVSTNAELRLEGGESISTPTFATGSSLTYYGTSNATLPSTITSYKNLIIDESGSSNPTFTLPNVDIDVAEGLVITDGTLAFDDDKNLTVDDQGGAAKALSIAADGVLSNTGIGDLILAGDVTNLGSVVFNSAGSDDNILVRSSVPGTKREWQGGGSYSFTDVTVTDQIANETTPGQISAISSTDGGSNLRWVFGPPDNCPGDADKLEPGICGCGVSDVDTDGDGTSDCQDGCPNDANKTTAGVSGCGVADDSDGDGVSDAQETIDGTNPNDSGSAAELLPTKWWSDTNSFLGMYNINEYMNKTSSDRNVAVTMFDWQGDALSSTGLTVPANGQADMLVHAMPEWHQDSYGLIYSEVSNASAGDIDGRTVYYKPNERGFDFAFALAYQAGLTGNQFVTFNNIQPSAAGEDSENLVANWIQVTNLSTSRQQGTIVFYGQDGEVLYSESIALESYERHDFAAHEIVGSGLAGLVKWSPQVNSAKFILRNMRYYYDNPEVRNSFDGGLQLDGLKGNGEPLVALFDTRGQNSVLEVANTTSSNVTVAIAIYNANGEVKGSLNLTLSPYSSEHIIVNNFLNEEVGSATIDGGSIGSVIAAAIDYEKTSIMGLSNVYGAMCRQALGDTLHGSYNTYLGQGCELLLVNSSSSIVSTQVTMTRSDGTVILSNEPIVTQGHATSSYNLCAQEEPNQYGVVMLSVDTENSILPMIIRSGASGEYKFTTRLR